MFEITTMTSKGQVTIPSHIRQLLHLQAGDKLRFIVDDHGGLVAFPIRGSIRDAYAVLPKPAKRLSEEEIAQAIGAAIAAKGKDHARD